ncbi:hypothetical protein L861_01655 [Litchfieldella anticariensis FP35 = DSM 16096]|uniref:SnoaL-like domain-containing protein n=1 Tax=Litchfieldella anticariensis (strain DSM 16096 / CECT 5854 / CIP 108499 / LMG 22089 / FP35) TaxID=1121939 RepID=S2LH96_LITA3|nr:nuclear transport factor 2 family protein [Halomonas anticariensis]EPC04036.1 hypothetical protein L861_01655 [Halomonas anticariensis FP35 = DSM 16096]
MSAEKVLDHHLDCFGRGDIEGIMSDYSSDSVLFLPDGVLVGKDNIKDFFEGLIEEFSKPGMSFDLKVKEAKGKAAYIVWSATTQDNIYEYATDTFVIENERVVIQSFAAKVVPR